MTILLGVLGVLSGYLIGGIPIGLVLVRLITGQDVRQVGSGRTGGTNAMRAGGVWVGLMTTALDVLKGAVSVWLARSLISLHPWVEAAAGLASVLGHNYSVFLMEWENTGSGVRRPVFRGGAGGSPTLGAAIAFWPAIGLVIVPLATLIFYFVGYASVTTVSVAALVIVIFSVRAGLGLSPWACVAFGALAGLALLWALRPNLARLAKGTERVHGFRARRGTSEGDSSAGEPPKA